MIRKNILNMPAYVPGEQINDCIKLNTNECIITASEECSRVLKNFDLSDIRVYSEPTATTMRKVASNIYDTHENKILVGNGSDDCLTIIYRSFLNKDDIAVCPHPTYGLYDTLAAIQDINIEHIDYVIKDDNWILPEALGLQNAKLTLVANPNNPSGTYTPVDDLRRLADQIDGILVVDEAYADFVSDDKKKSILPYLDEHPNLIVLKTFSKSYSLAGTRLGLLFASENLVSQFMKVKDSYNVNAISQAIGIAALKDQEHLQKIVRQTLFNRKILEDAIIKFGWSFPKSEANFLLCEVGEMAKEIYEKLKEQNILVRYWNTDELKTKLRITVGTTEQQNLLINAIEEILGKK